MTDTGLRGLELLDAAIAQIEAHPETWKQGSYRCGTGMCLAAHIGELAGGWWVIPDDADHPRSQWMVAEPGDPPEHVDTESDYGPMIHVSDRAEHLLGFSRYISLDDAEADDNGETLESDDLFDGLNTLEDIRAIRDVIASGGEVWP
jgi:hypothetical protein